MFVASQDGIETLDLEFEDPLVCTYKTDGALDAQEMQNYRNRHAHKRNNRAVQWRDLRHS
jgi:hypothetical protein